MELNTFLSHLSRFCSEHIIEEKWLLAPSLRIGQQWLDALARAGLPVLNVRLQTLRGLALDLALPQAQQGGSRFLSALELEILVGRLFESLDKGDGYLTKLPLTPGLLAALNQTLTDLRTAGLLSDQLQGRYFEVDRKGQELRQLLHFLEQQLTEKKLLDYAEVLRRAAQQLRDGSTMFPPDRYIVRAADQKMNALEEQLWDAIPSSQVVVLQVDQQQEPPEGVLPDCRLLSWIQRPTEAPAARQDGSAAMFSAVGEINEAREVLRRCMAQQVPFDKVEILCTEEETYIPLFYELLSMLAAQDESNPGMVRATFAAGLPTRYFRPGRALQAWVEWNRSDYPQAILLEMIRDGLLSTPEKSPSFARLAGVFRNIGIFGHKERYMPALQAAIEAAQASLANRLRKRDEDGVPENGGDEKLQARIEALKALLEIVTPLLHDVPPIQASELEVLTAAGRVIGERVRGAGELDEYARHALQTAINEMSAAIVEFGAPPGFSAWDWLAGLPTQTRVGGQGPRPGCLHIAGLLNGGHSSRPYTFLLGLDDSRFPGAGLMDPLLLDEERRRHSAGLPTAASRMARKIEDSARLLARLRGSVCLSYSRQSLEDDREVFPSSQYLAAYRILSNERDGDQHTMKRWLGPPSSFAPGNRHECLHAGDWWLHRVLREAVGEDHQSLVLAAFPHLSSGAAAQACRESDRFTEYDGFVPEAGRDIDPGTPGGHLLSPSRLESFAANPLEFFFKYVLKVEPPDDIVLDPAQWLDALQVGSLLHGVFRDFMQELLNQGLGIPEFERDRDLIVNILERHITEWRQEVPPPNMLVLEARRVELRGTVLIFLQEEERWLRANGWEPFCFEATFGMAPEGAGTPIDTPEPWPVTLPNGRVIRVRGRVDRINRRINREVSEEEFEIWDYKSGGTWKYRWQDPFRQGRVMQSILYPSVMGVLLKEKHSNRAQVSRFGYFFPGTKTRGSRIYWPTSALREGWSIVQQLCDMMAAGCFPASNEKSDYTFSDYQSAMGDLSALIADMARKLENVENSALEPFRALRQIEVTGKGSES